MKNAIAIPRGTLTAAIDSSSGRDDGISGVSSDGEDSRPAVIMEDGDGISVGKMREDHFSLEL